MSRARVLRQKNDLLPNDGFHVIHHFKVALLLDVTPDLDEIKRDGPLEAYIHVCKYVYTHSGIGYGRDHDFHPPGHPSGG